MPGSMPNTLLTTQDLLVKQNIVSIFFCSSEVGTQGLALARQTLYHFSQSPPALFTLVIFAIRSWTFCNSPGLRCVPLHSWDGRCVPPHPALVEMGSCKRSYLKPTSFRSPPPE
jgi:hypothetical protein